MNMQVLTMKVGALCGSSIEEIFPQAAALASKLGLAMIEFNFNGDNGIAYPNGRGRLYDCGAHLVGTWTQADGFHWQSELQKGSAT